MPAGFELNLLLTIKASQGTLWGTRKKNSLLYQLLLAFPDEKPDVTPSKWRNLEDSMLLQSKEQVRKAPGLVFLALFRKLVGKEGKESWAGVWAGRCRERLRIYRATGEEREWRYALSNSREKLCFEAWEKKAEDAGNWECLILQGMSGWASGTEHGKEHMGHIFFQKSFSERKRLQ